MGNKGKGTIVQKSWLVYCYIKKEQLIPSILYFFKNKCAHITHRSPLLLDFEQLILSFQTRNI